MNRSRKPSNQETQARVARLIDIGVALSAETDLDVLLVKIVQYSREITRADAGTLYILSDGKLHFRIIQNDSLGVSLGGASGGEINLDPVPIVESNVSGRAALTGSTIRIEDVYSSTEFDFEGPRNYDAQTGYKSRSMLVCPMKDTGGKVIGFLQLMNSIDQETGKVRGFCDDDVHICEALASQAAVAVTNAHLVTELNNMMDALIKVLGVAVDAKSAYTGNHVQRVATLNVALASAVSASSDPPFSDVSFSEKQLEEIKISGWLHDVGKVTTPVHIMDKAKKLETIFDRIDLVKERFFGIKKFLEVNALKEKLKIALQGPNGNDPAEIDKELEKQLTQLNIDFQFLAECNQPGEFLDNSKLDRICEIAGKTYEEEGKIRNYLTEDETKNLSIRKGTLTDEEMDVMRGHVECTKKMLDQIPFADHLKNVVLYASQHHERLNAKGYPKGLKAEQIPLQSRILAIADLYEALSAKDRPYKKSMNLKTILSILEKCASDGEIDKDVLNLLVNDKIYLVLDEKSEDQEPAEVIKQGAGRELRSQGGRHG